MSSLRWFTWPLLRLTTSAVDKESSCWCWQKAALQLSGYSCWCGGLGDAFCRRGVQRAEKTFHASLLLVSSQSPSFVSHQCSQVLLLPYPPLQTRGVCWKSPFLACSIFHLLPHWWAARLPAPALRLQGWRSWDSAVHLCWESHLIIRCTAKNISGNPVKCWFENVLKYFRLIW